MDDDTTRWKKKLHRLIKPDWVFALMLIGPIAALLFPPSDIAVGGEVILAWPFKAIIIIFLLLAISFIATFGVAFDKKFADDYHFQLMANGAVVGIMGVLFVSLTFDLLDMWLPQLGAKEMLSILLGSWSLGYFFYRIKGLKP
ncbi:hypothetical protein [Parasphingorhabdus halotolerans]|uniref:Uncharacterized protein n=1 Tax=Parasphingorhabdus halotolerans TaxID=2725558 RepID=A0A6H2DKN3_9SPHN|nr:hypothetical protein [Parasphingorhabdus halotolerans]QJB68904.1 hypothetical protein HF685_06130 [Parasphingorhabdus halotolerans]